LTPQEAVIYLMIMASASDGSIHDAELRAIGRVVRSFPLFDAEDEQELTGHSDRAAQLMASDGGLHKVIDAAKAALPSHLVETAYAAVVDVVTADEALNPEEIRILEIIRDGLSVGDDGAAAIEHAARARHMTIEAPL
ncbi:MAG: tellurite resistance TerB family protein, partial [Pseudomonadota bacterium]